MQIKGFSKKDSELIYHLALNEEMINSFRILSIHFDEEPIKFEIEDVHSKYSLCLTAEEIISAKTMLRNFSSEDISMIYFQLMKENEQRIKQSKLIQKSQIEVQGKIYFLKKPGVNE